MLAFQKQKVNKQTLSAIIADIYTAHGVTVPADFECKSAASACVGTVVIDGITWPVWNAEYSARPSVIWVTKLTGKLDLFPGITTSCNMNPHCVARMNNGACICSDCFAHKTLDRYDGADEHAAINTLLLANHRIPADLLPLFLNSRRARLEPFGDLQNTTQAENYFDIIEANAGTDFGWWTKNPGYIKQVLKHRRRPENVSFIFSGFFKNNAGRPVDVDRIKALFPFVDHVFIVYTPDFIAENGVEINCGARCCGSCGACYKRDGAFVIREKLK